jgi:hypothetical protein
MAADGSSQTNLTGSMPSGNSHAEWSPDGQRIAFINLDLYVMTADGTGITKVFQSSAGAQPLSAPAWSPDGTMIAFRTLDGFCQGCEAIRRIPANGGQATTVFQSPNGAFLTLDWQPLQASPNYVRPRSASPIKVSLVPAFAACTSPNRQHGPPLAFPSCNPPAASSVSVTTSAPAGSDNANMVGTFMLRASISPPGSEQSSDIGVQGSVADVRCLAGTQTCGNANAVGGPDYVGELQATTTVRWTDRHNGTPAAEAGTMVDLPLRFPIICNNTPSTAEGASCSSTATSLNALFPGAVLKGKRSVIEAGQVGVLDGGPDGDAESGPNTEFLKQGVFVP